MWLINTSTLELEGFQQCPVDTYAILSHTWGAESEELNFDEFRAGEGRHKVGFEKIERCCELALDNSLDYVWVDTCCIDKRSSAELSEAINSMFSWYESAKECYVYLADVGDSDLVARIRSDDTFPHSRWFTRGWTLQELIAPKVVFFYDRHWILVGNRQTLTKALHTATRIDLKVLEGTKGFRNCSIAQRMSWAANRNTTRPEDLAYCLLGLFNVNIPLLYGEGLNAFLRLQEEIVRHTDDESIFAWTGDTRESYGFLAPSPSCFSDATSILGSIRYGERPHVEITNRGLKLECQMIPCEMNTYAVPLQCERLPPSGYGGQISVFIARTRSDDQYRRVSCKDRWVADAADFRNASGSKTSTIYVSGDTQFIELAPRGGQPFVHIVSDLYAWQFPRPESRELLQIPDMILNTREALPARKNVTKQSANTIEFTRFVKASPSSFSQKSKVICGELGSYESETHEWTPRNVSAIQFQPWDLRGGVAVAFTRSDSWQHKFYYHVEIGFDMDFMPVCVVYTQPFKLAIQNNSRLSDRFTQYLRLVVGNRGHVPLWRDFWNHEGCRCLGATPAMEYSLDRGKCKVCCLGISSSWYPMIIQTEPFDLNRTRGQHHERNDVWIARGHRFYGLDLDTNDSLPYSYGCVDLVVSIRHLQGLEWELEVKEVPLHIGPNRHGIFCKQRVKVSYARALQTFILVAVDDNEMLVRFATMSVIYGLVLQFVLEYFCDITFSVTIQSISFGIGIAALADSTIFYSLVMSLLLEITALLQSSNERLANGHRNHDDDRDRMSISRHKFKNSGSGRFLFFFGLTIAIGCPLQYSFVATIICCYLTSMTLPF